MPYKEKPSNRTLTKSKWVFKVEYKDGAIKRFKARIVACGYSQIEGLDWTENYASTLSADSLRCFCFDANQSGYELQEADVVKAFTHASLEEEIYMAPPEGYAPKDGKVCFLLKGVEGLKQGANGFMKLNAKVIEGEGFSRSMLDPTVFIRTKENRAEGRLLRGQPAVCLPARRAWACPVCRILQGVRQEDQLGDPWTAE